MKTILKDNLTTLILPKTKAEVKMRTTLTGNDFLKLNGDSKTILGRSLEALAYMIKEWSLYEKETSEKPLNITEENIKRLPMEDINFLLNSIEKTTEKEKKN